MLMQNPKFRRRNYFVTEPVLVSKYNLYNMYNMNNLYNIVNIISLYNIYIVGRGAEGVYYKIYYCFFSLASMTYFSLFLKLSSTRKTVPKVPLPIFFDTAYLLTITRLLVCTLGGRFCGSISTFCWTNIIGKLIFRYYYGRNIYL